MGVPCSLPGVDLELVSQETSDVQLKGPTVNSTATTICERDDRHESHCSCHRESHSISSFSCGQKRYHQEENGSRYVSAKQVHSMSKIQNDYGQFSETCNVRKGMDCHVGLKERLLACSDTPKVSTSSGFQNRQSNLPVQSHALWTEHSSKDIYEAVCSDNQGTQDERHYDLCLPRRLDNLGSVSQALPSGSANIMQSHSEVWFYNKSREIGIHSNSENSVAGANLGYQEPNSFSAPNLSGEGQGSIDNILTVEIHHPPSSRKNSRLDKFRLRSQSSRQDLSQESQPFVKRVCKVSSPRYSSSSVTRAQSKAFVLAQAESAKFSSSLALSSTNSRTVHGRIQRGLGLPHIRSPTRLRSVESSHGLLPHQCEGVCCSLDRPTELSVEQRDLNQASCRQQPSGMLHQSGGLDEIETSMVLDSFDCSFVGFEDLDPNSGSHKRGVEGQNASGFLLKC